MNCVEQILEIDELLADDVPLTGGVPAVETGAGHAAVQAPKAADNRRAHPRVGGRSLEWIAVARVKYGPEVKVVDLSTGGVLLESDRPLAPGSRQALEIAGVDRSIVVPFGVLRSRISSLGQGGPIYRSACRFTKPLDLPELSAAESGIPVSASVSAKP
jgi:hypothetical protein